MYVSYLLDNESSMYGGPARCSSSSSSGSSSSLPGQSFAPAPPYPDYMGYHVGALDAAGPPPGPWGSHYPAQHREDWPAFGPGPGPAQLSAPAPQGSYSPAEYSAPQPAQPGPHSPARHGAFDWMRRAAPATATGKTRTREKYRVVYTDHQRLELEKEFHYNRYITIRRKSELAANLRLSERQVKIWFQNRRAKERKLMKKKLSHLDGSAVGSLQGGPGPVGAGSPMAVPEPPEPPALPPALFPPPAPLPAGALQHPGALQQVLASQ
ncbi:homeobox protein CDX-1-like [Pithys albifrons albifrons]